MMPVPSASVRVGGIPTTLLFWITTTCVSVEKKPGGVVVLRSQMKNQSGVNGVGKNKG